MADLFRVSRRFMRIRSGASEQRSNLQLQELRNVLEAQGMRVVRVGGIGSLSNLCGKEVVRNLRARASAWAAFVDLCDDFDLASCRTVPCRAVASRVEIDPSVWS
jgi:hypothetical protein